MSLDPTSVTVTTSVLLKTPSAASTTMKAFIFLCLLHVSFGMSRKNFTNPNWGSSSGSTVKKDEPVCTTNEASCGCCLMLRQIHKMELFFNETISALENSLTKTRTILSNVRSSRSAFSVALTNADTLTCIGPFRDDTLVRYKHVFINLGNNYDVDTGFFTVPRSGVYSLALTVYSDAGAPASSLAACANLQVNNVLVAGPQEKNKQDQEDSASIVIVIHLKAGDLVTVHLPIGCFLCDDKSHYNTFSGHLLYGTE